MAVVTSRESSDEKDRQRQAARESHKKVSLVIARRRALKDMTMDLEKRGSRVLPALATALARPSASSSHRGTCRPRRRQRLRLPKPRCGGDCQDPCPSPSRLSGLLGVHTICAYYEHRFMQKLMRTYPMFSYVLLAGWRRPTRGGLPSRARGEPTPGGSRITRTTWSWAPGLMPVTLYYISLGLCPPC